MNRNEIGVNAGKVWQLLSNNEKWSYGLLKRKSGLKDKELGAALCISLCECLYWLKEFGTLTKTAESPEGWQPGQPFGDSRFLSFFLLMYLPFN